MYVDASIMNLMQQNIQVTNSGDAQAQAAAHAVRLDAELRFREYEDFARGQVQAEMQELRNFADQQHHSKIAHFGL